MVIKKVLLSASNRPANTAVLTSVSVSGSAMMTSGPFVSQARWRIFLKSEQNNTKLSRKLLSKNCEGLKVVSCLSQNIEIDDWIHFLQNSKILHRKVICKLLNHFEAFYKPIKISILISNL